MAKTFICSDESINRYGFRVLTSGIDISSFKKNPVMLFDHESMSWGGDIYNGPIGRWDNVKKENNELIADAIVDEDDPKGKILNNKIEKDFIRAASIGFRVIETSEDPKLMLPGQTRPTVTKCELIEISLVGIPANRNAVTLFDDAGNKIDLKEDASYSKLGLGQINSIQTMKKISLKAGLLALAAFFGLSNEQAEKENEIDFSPEKQEELNSKLNSLATLQADKTRLEGELQNASTEKTNLQNQLSTATSEKAELQKKLDAANAEITRLGNQPGNTTADPAAGSKEGAEGEKKENLFLSEADQKLAALKAEMGLK